MPDRNRSGLAYVAFVGILVRATEIAPGVTQEDGFQNAPPGVRVVSTSPEILVEVDGEKLRTVLRNLLENAMKYSFPQSHPVELSAARAGDTVVIPVIDHGPGIPESDRERLFEPFFRIDRSRTKSTGGYGLGLSISKRIVEAHGGTIGVENNAARVPRSR